MDQLSAGISDGISWLMFFMEMASAATEKRAKAADPTMTGRLIDMNVL